MARELEHRDTARRQYARELAHVLRAELRSDVLQDDVGVDEVERVVVEEGKVVAVVDVVPAAVAELIQLTGPLDHRRGDVDAVALGERARERLREPADTAAEVERAAGFHLDAELAHPREYLVDFVDTGAKEFLEVPPVPASVGTRDDRPVGITTTPLVPVTLEFVQIHGRMLSAFGRGGGPNAGPGCTRTGAGPSASISSSPRLLPYAHSSTSSSPRSVRSRVAFSGPRQFAPRSGRCIVPCVVDLELRAQHVRDAERVGRPRRDRRRATRRRSRPRGPRGGATRCGRGPRR